MAIQFARIEIVGRSNGGNACCKGAYNARSIIKDEKTNITYNFVDRGDNVHHEVLLPAQVDAKFQDISALMNAVEKSEKQKNSQLLKDVVIALPDDKELTLQDRINITHEIVEEMEWVKEGLGVQVDIHEPHDGEKNWHAHLLITTRRFTECGQFLSPKKARDLNPEFKNGKGTKGFIIPEEDIIHERSKRIINRYFEKLGIQNRVDAVGMMPQEHVGPVRMRSALNQAVQRNEERRQVNIESLRDGSDVIGRVQASVFSKKDLSRIVRCIPDKVRANRLASEALNGSEVLKLYHQDGTDSGLYTTVDIREQELKLLRLSSYIQDNLVYQTDFEHLISSDQTLDQEQKSALSHLLLASGGMRILQGRAGTGKSRVLNRVASYAKLAGINTIGLAPTHKAVSALRAFEADTIKGFLFKLYNDRVNLPKGTLIVVDEAGMVSNRDYQELLRVAATWRCNVILSGDDRQLGSIGKGGMFKVFADKFGSCKLTSVKRQTENWGREVAESFAGGDVLTGIEILKSHGKLSRHDNKIDSMERLLLDWHSSGAKKLIIAVKNTNVDALNAGARELLKENGVLKGEEYTVDKYCYMEGDKVVFNATSKEYGVSNGDFGEITHASKEEFRVRLDKGGEVSFNPANFSGFKHGYASTIYKAQGASIEVVYVLHDGFLTMKNSYVAMSRHIKDLYLYINSQATKNEQQLIRQLSFSGTEGASMHYLTEDDLKRRGVFSKIVNFAKEQVVTLWDKHKVDNEYYVFDKPKESKVRVEEMLEHCTQQKYAEIKTVGVKNVLVAGSNQSSNPKKMTPKERFYSRVDRSQRVDYRHETQALRQEAKYKAESIARNLLGAPNERLSNGSTLRYGERGRLAIRVTGDKVGSWYDFEQSKGGDIFDLIQDQQNCDFKGAVEYLRGNYSTGGFIDIRAHDRIADHYKKRRQEELELANKVKRTTNLIARAKAPGNTSIVSRYLEHRSIRCHPGDDVKTVGVYEKEARKSLPALVAFGKNMEGQITGGQQILLDPKTAKKADVSVQKRSFGNIAGSFVHISDSKTGVTIIAEGLETALSIKQAGIDAKILCSIGISNIKNYAPKDGEKVIIAADNDGNRFTVIEKAQSILSKSAIVKIVRPEMIGDFNDVLKDQGQEKIREMFSPIKELNTKTLDEFLSAKDREYLTKSAKEDLSYIKEQGICKDKILFEFKNSYDRGILELGLTREGHQINTFAKLKAAAKTPDQAMEALEKEQSFLAGLKYPEHHGTQVSVVAALAKTHTGALQQLHKISTYLIEKNLKTQKQMTQTIKDTTNPMATQKELVKHYHSHVTSELRKCLYAIDEGKISKVDDKHFDCPLKLLNHTLKQNTHNEFFPREEIKQTYSNLLDLDKHMCGLKL